MTNSARRIEILMRHFRLAIEGSNPNVQFALKRQGQPSDDPSRWVMKVHGIDGDYKGGEYLYRIVIPHAYPDEIPSIYAMTPNGLFAVETDICVTGGKFHPESRVHTLSIGDFAYVSVVSPMIADNELGGGIGIINQSAETKRRFAAASVEWNKKHYAEDLKALEEQHEICKKVWDPPREPS